jgi:hypothetical protein
MSIKNIILLSPFKLSIGLLVLILVISASVHATDVRGRVDFNARNGIFPMNGAFVELCQQGRGCLSYRTGYDGMYYFNAAPGPHDILVNGRMLFQLVIPNQPYYDVRPLQGN